MFWRCVFFFFPRTLTKLYSPCSLSLGPDILFHALCSLFVVRITVVFQLFHFIGLQVYCVMGWALLVGWWFHFFIWFYLIALYQTVPGNTYRHTFTLNHADTKMLFCNCQQSKINVANKTLQEKEFGSGVYRFSCYKTAVKCTNQVRHSNA